MFCGHLFSEALKSHFEVVHLCGPELWSDYDYPMPREHYLQNYVGASFDPSEYDVILSIDHGTVATLAEIKRDYPDKVVGAQVLDFPEHVFKKNKDYNANVQHRWEQEFLPCIRGLDFILYEKEIAKNLIEKLIPPKVMSWNFRYPVDPIVFKEYERKDFIVYSGRLKPDKGVHYVIDALALIEEDIEFITIGSGYDFSSYADHLNVRYKNIVCSEEEKWKLYHESRFIVCGADNPNVTSLCVSEGISIGRCGIVFDFEENKLHYKNFAWYCLPLDIRAMAKTIDYMYHNPELADDRAIGGKEFYEKNYSYEAWGNKFYEMFQNRLGDLSGIR